MTGMTRSNEIHFIRDSPRTFSSIFLSFGLFLIALNVHGTTLWAQVLPVPESKANTSVTDSMPPELPTYIILDDPKQMGELFKRLSKPDFQLLRPSSVVEPAKSSEEQPGFIRSMQINGRVEGNTVSLRLYYEIDQIKPGKVWTKIGLDGISLQSVQSNGKNMIATVIKDKSWAVQTEKIGVHKIEVQFAIDIISDRSTKRILFSIPECPSTAFDLDVPETVLFATTNNRDQLALKYDEKRKSFLISSMLSPRSKIDIKWLGQSLLVRDDSHKIECRGLISLKLDADSVSTRQYWQIIPMYGLVRELHFDLAPDVMVTDIQINGQAVKSIASNLASGKIRMTIKVPESLLLVQKDPVTCEIVTKESYSQSTRNHVDVSRQIQWSAPEWKDSAITSGIIALEYPEKWFDLTGGSQQLIPVDSRDLPDRLRKFNALSAFQFNDTLQNVNFNVRAKSSPIITKSHTIGIVRDNQVEYITEIEFLGEIVKSADYHLKLGLKSQILFVGPRDLWEGYDLMPSTKDSPFIQLKITPNKTSSPSGKQLVRVRYVQRIDSKSGFEFVSPAITESQSSQDLVWLVAKPGFSVVNTAKMDKSKSDISQESIKSLTLLLDQSIADDDKWLNSNLIRSGMGWFHQSFSSSESFKLKIAETPPHLTYHQEIDVLPQSKSLKVKYKFDCFIDSGQLSVINFQKKRFLKAGESYQVTINGKKVSGNDLLVFNRDIAELKLDSPLFGKNQIIIEQTINPVDDISVNAKQMSDRTLNLQLEEFSILNGNCASRRIRSQSVTGTKIIMPENTKGWQKSFVDESESHELLSTDKLVDLPVLEWIQIRNTRNSKNVCVVEKIQSFYNSDKPDQLSVFYTIQSEATDLIFSEHNGLKPYSSIILNSETGILKSDSGFKIPLNNTPKRFVLTVQYRHNSAIRSFESPLPKECDVNQFISSQLIYETDKWHFPCINLMTGLYKSMVPAETYLDYNGKVNSSTTLFHFGSTHTNQPLTIYRVHILFPVVLVILATFMKLVVFAYYIDKEYQNLFVLGLSSVCLSLYLNENVNIWFISAVTVGTCVHLFLDRFDIFRSRKNKVEKVSNQDTLTIVSSVSQTKTKEPSTVLKFLSQPIPLQTSQSQVIDQVWSVPLEFDANAPDSKITEVIKGTK